jgi:hypothetical protein
MRDIQDVKIAFDYIVCDVFNSNVRTTVSARCKEQALKLAQSHRIFDLTDTFSVERAH